MVKKQESGWKPITLNEHLISRGIDGLIGIEELTDYRIEKSFDPTSKLKAKIVNTKRKAFPESAAGPKITKKVKLDKADVKHDTVSENAEDKVPGKYVQNVSNANCAVKTKKKKRKTKRKKLVSEESVNNVKEQKSESKTQLYGEQDVDKTVLQEMKTWTELHVPLPVIRALADLGFKEPTQIQSLALLPAIKGRRDILGAAETGSGKTLAFGIPIIYGILQQRKKELLKGNLTEKMESGSEEETDKDENELEEQNKMNDGSEDERETEKDEDILELDEESEIGCVKVVNETSEVTTKKKLYALIITPTRELAMQVRDHLVAVAKYTGIKVAVVVGGMASQKQERLLKQGPEIVVGTPGRLWELIENGNSHLAQISNIDYLAIDETDRMLEKGHFQELQVLLERINQNESRKKQRQNFVFSATLTLVHEPPKYVGKVSHRPKRITPGQKLQGIISSLGITNPKVVDITQKFGTAETLSEARIVCSINEKDFYLYYFLLRHSGRTLIFCNSISCVRRLAQILTILQCHPLPLHANMQQRQRLKNLERFRDSPNGVLLATDVAARGLDIPNVEHVIHYQVPRTSEVYVHRSGRTARAQKEGLTLLLIEPSEVQYYLRLCKTLGRDKDLPNFPIDETIFKSVRERVLLARQLDQLDLQLRRSKSESNWFEKAAKDMDLILDENEKPHCFDEETSSQVKKRANILRKQMQEMLNKPVFSNSTLFNYANQGKVDESVTKSSAVEAFKKRKKMKPGRYVRLAV